RPPDRPLQRELFDQLSEHPEGELALRVVRLGARNRRAFHLTRRYEGVGERRLAHTRVAEQHGDAWLPPSHLQPGVVQAGELALSADQPLRFEAPLAPPRDLSRYGPPPGRAAPFPQPLRNPHPLPTRLRLQLLPHPGL